MTQMKATIDKYVDEVKNRLVDLKYEDSEIEEIVKRISDPYDKVDPIAKIKGHKSLKKIYLSDVNPDDMFYISLNDRVKALSIKTGDKEYNVSFSFYNSKDDIFNSATGNTWKKYPLMNYIKGKFKYSVEATSHVNAICLAYNKNKKDFPGKEYKTYKASPYVSYIWPWTEPKPVEVDDSKESPEFKPITQPPYFKRSGIQYFELKNKLRMSGIKLNDVRYYITSFSELYYSDPGVSAMVVKNEDNTFTVTFSFISKDDKDYIINYYYECGCPVDIKNAAKVALINNRLNNKFTYTVSDTRNSISSVVKAFNKNRRSFPTKFRKFKVKLDAVLVTK